MKAVDIIFRANSRTYKHDFEKKPLMIDLDMTGLLCGKTLEESKKGYQAQLGIRYGRQLCRTVAADYNEVIVDRLYPGNLHFSKSVHWMIWDTAEALELSEANKSRTVIRMDAGGGANIGWLLEQGYQVHSKECNPRRAEGFSLAVKKWVPDPANPSRELGWMPTDLGDFVRPVKRIIMRWKKDRTGKRNFACLVSTVEPKDVMRLLGRPANSFKNKDQLLIAYSKLYDMRAGVSRRSSRKESRVWE